MMTFQQVTITSLRHFNYYYYISVSTFTCEICQESVPLLDSREHHETCNHEFGYRGDIGSRGDMKQEKVVCDNCGLCYPMNEFVKHEVHIYSGTSLNGHSMKR